MASLATRTPRRAAEPLARFWIAAAARYSGPAVLLRRRRSPAEEARRLLDADDADAEAAVLGRLLPREDMREEAPPRPNVDAAVPGLEPDGSEQLPGRDPGGHGVGVIISIGELPMISLTAREEKSISHDWLI